MRKQGGFTLIELITVIVILGILSAIALPRFSGLEVDARMAKMRGAVGAVRAAAALAHGVWLAKGQVSPITMEGVPIAIVNGYPAAGSIAAAAGLATSDYSVVVAGTTATIRDPSVTTCSFTYTQPAALGSQPTVTTTAITTANCD